VSSLVRTGVGEEWIVHEDMGARHGCAVRLTVAPGGGYEVHRHRGAERVIYVLDGAGTHLGVGGPAEVHRDDALVIPAGAWHGFRNSGPEPVRLLILATPATRLKPEDCEPAGQQEVSGGELIRHRLHEVAGRPDVATPEQGFDGLEVVWDGAAGAAAITLGFARFPPGATHRWHRHTQADEGGTILSGTMFHLFDDDGRQRLSAGDHTFMPAGQWHSVETDPSCTMVDTVWFYLGAASLAASGYELRHSPVGQGR
jgi:quercetin dioxygenase-like cupin family protein